MADGDVLSRRGSSTATCDNGKARGNASSLGLARRATALSSSTSSNRPSRSFPERRLYGTHESRSLSPGRKLIVPRSTILTQAINRQLC